jgi:hypothetical protein
MQTKPIEAAAKKALTRSFPRLCSQIVIRFSTAVTTIVALTELSQDGLPQAHHTQSQLNHTLPGPRDDEHERRAIAAAAPNASAVWNRLAEGSAHGGATESTVR